MPNRFDNNTVESRLARIENELELARVRDGRNIRHILKVMTMQHAEVMAAIHPPSADKKALLAFGKPGEKLVPLPESQPGKSTQPHLPLADKPKEKTK